MNQTVVALREAERTKSGEGGAMPIRWSAALVGRQLCVLSLIYALLQGVALGFDTNEDLKVNEGQASQFVVGESPNGVQHKMLVSFTDSSKTNREKIIILWKLVAESCTIKLGDWCIVGGGSSWHRVWASRNYKQDGLEPAGLLPGGTYMITGFHKTTPPDPGQPWFQSAIQKEVSGKDTLGKTYFGALFGDDDKGTSMAQIYPVRQLSVERIGTTNATSAEAAGFSHVSTTERKTPENRKIPPNHPPKWQRE